MTIVCVIDTHIPFHCSSLMAFRLLTIINYNECNVQSLIVTEIFDMDGLQ